jgi:hypothetical protein
LKETVQVNKDEVQYFEAPTEHEGETVDVIDTRLIIVAPSFQEGNKWRVSDGSRNIFVNVEDPNFIRAVQTGAEAFSKGGLLHVQLQTRQWLEGTALKAEYSILKVYRHERGPEQRRLQLLRNGEADKRIVLLLLFFWIQCRYSRRNCSTVLT